MLYLNDMKLHVFLCIYGQSLFEKDQNTGQYLLVLPERSLVTLCKLAYTP